MSLSEFDSFVGKFKFLWHAGYDATLKVETTAGKASITLQAVLGFCPFPFPPPQLIPRHVPRPSGPSQRRRRERREAARKAASENANIDETNPGATEHEVPDNEVDEDNVVDYEATEEEADNPEATEEEADQPEATAEEADQAEIANSDYKCDLCESSFENIRGLRTHKGRAHKATCSPIVQLDGQREGSEKNESEISDTDESDNDVEYPCDKCTFSSKTLSNMMKHKNRNHLFTTVKGWTSR